jgi:hypothetical protein
MSASIKRAVPGGGFATTTKAYCSGWRKYAESIAAATGWAIHSFGNGHVRFVSSDYKHTQSIGIEFIEPLADAVRKGYKWKKISQNHSQFSEPSSSVESTTQAKSHESPQPSTDQNTWTFVTKKGL